MSINTLKNKYMRGFQIGELCANSMVFLHTYEVKLRPQFLYFHITVHNKDLFFTLAVYSFSQSVQYHCKDWSQLYLALVYLKRIIFQPTQAWLLNIWDANSTPAVKFELPDFK